MSQPAQPPPNCQDFILVPLTISQVGRGPIKTHTPHCQMLKQLGTPNRIPHLNKMAQVGGGSMDNDLCQFPANQTTCPFYR